VIAESLLQVCALVIGNDATLTQAGRGSHFELNMMLPVAAYCLLQSVSLLASASLNFSRQCVEGLTATPRGPELVEKGLALATALAPKIGYDAAAGIAKEAASTGRSVREVALERAGLSEAELDAVLDPAKMVEAGL
jgi:fumarate hydratase class II